MVVCLIFNCSFLLMVSFSFLFSREDSRTQSFMSASGLAAFVGGGYAASDYSKKIPNPTGNPTEPCYGKQLYVRLGPPTVLRTVPLYQCTTVLVTSTI